MRDPKKDTLLADWIEANADKQEQAIRCYGGARGSGGKKVEDLMKPRALATANSMTRDELIAENNYLIIQLEAHRQEKARAVPELWVFDFNNGTTAWTRDPAEAVRIRRYLQNGEKVTEYVRLKGNEA